MSFENRTGQVIEISATVSAMIPLAFWLSFIAPMFYYFVRPTVRTTCTIRPAQLTDSMKTLGVIYNLSDIQYIMRLIPRGFHLRFSQVSLLGRWYYQDYETST
ncbi:MAG: hypothetical protein BECKG1743F_GA0114225_111924 [Candidatus Kentron sp. G]|nr:MAG: hypothetical protein BECKG1743F_GA0114225_111924 [Candidatus Kentron sp. G]